MRRTRFDDWPCPIARTTDLLADWWTPLVLRQAFSGERRFEEIQRSLGIPRAVLTARLDRLVDEGVLTAEPYQDNPVRHEYRLTDKGRATWDILAAMWRWGSDWAFEGEPTVILSDRRTHREIRPMVIDENTGEALDVRHTRMRPNPAAEPGG